MRRCLQGKIRGYGQKLKDGKEKDVARDGVLLGRIGRAYRRFRLLQKAAGKLPGKKKAAEEKKLSGKKVLKAAGAALLLRKADPLRRKRSLRRRILKLVTGRKALKLMKKIFLTPKG